MTQQKTTKRKLSLRVLMRLWIYLRGAR